VVRSLEMLVRQSDPPWLAGVQADLEVAPEPALAYRGLKARVRKRALPVSVFRE
jgi:hypothetical protein